MGLDRFVQAQDPVWAQVRAELQAGRKRTHWMWFVFPQCAGLGFSAMARHYALGSMAEAKAYLDHPVLGSRLQESTGWVMACGVHDVHTIFGSPDDLKFHACMTLFGLARPGPGAFQAALERFFGGAPHPGTVALMQPAG